MKGINIWIDCVVHDVYLVTGLSVLSLKIINILQIYTKPVGMKGKKLLEESERGGIMWTEI